MHMGQLWAISGLFDAAMALSYVGIGVIIFWFGWRRPDMGPAVLFNILAVVFALCGLTHATHVFSASLSGVAVVTVVHGIAAIASVATLALLIALAPRSLRIPSVAQLRQVNERLERETAGHRETSHQLRKLGAAVEQNPAIIILTDAEGRIEYVNQVFETITGYGREEAIGKTPSIIRSPHTPPEVHAEIWATLTNGHTWTGELCDQRKDGALLWVSTSIAPLNDEDGRVTNYVAIQQDITEQKHAEREMDEARAQAEIASRAKSELLANMSHELRTPLNAILGFSSLMEKELLGPLGHEKYREYVTDIQQSGEHLLALINDVLDVSAIEAGRLELHEEDCPLSSLIEAARRLIVPRAAKAGVGFETDAGPPASIRVDGRRFKQILLNLLTNAVKFTPEGGHVSLTARRNSKDGLELQVRDTGVGMNRDGIAKALQAFGQVDSRLQRRYEGTGLGLPITISLVEMHGGTWHIASEPGQGTTVTVTIPADRITWAPAVPDGVVSPPAPDGARSTASTQKDRPA